MQPVRSLITEKAPWNRTLYAVLKSKIAKIPADTMAKLQSNKPNKILLQPKPIPNQENIYRLFSLKTASLITLWAIIPIFYILQGQDANWDLQNYHLYNTISLFEDRLSTDIAPAGMQTYYNPLVSFPAYLIHRLASTPTESFWFGFALASFQGLCGPIVFAITQLIIPASNILAFFIALFGLTSPMLLSEAGSSMADLTICVFQLSSIYICLRSLKNTGKSRLRALSIGWGILGAACAIKFSAVFALPLSLIISLISLHENSKPILSVSLLKRGFYSIVIPWLVGFTIFGWLWFSRSWTDNGNPLYPLFSSIFGESKIFTTDNHDDKRFVVDGFLEYFTAPFSEFINTSKLRAEVPYRDLRPMLSIYLSVLSLFVALIGFARRELLIPQENIKKILILIGFQAGIIISYVIWMRETGIARYTMHLQILSGVCICISLLILSRSGQILGGQVLSSSPNSNFFTINRSTSYIFLFLLAISIMTTQVPNWGRASFHIRWNTLKPLGSDKEFSSTKYLLDTNQKNIQNMPVVLVDKPLGWLKQYSPSGNNFSLVDGYLRENFVDKIKANISSSGGQFIAIGLVEKNKISSDKIVSLAKNNFKFITYECNDYTTPTNIQIRKCLSGIDKD